MGTDSVDVHWCTLPGPSHRHMIPVRFETCLEASTPPSPKIVPLVVYIDGVRHVIGRAGITQDGKITAELDGELGEGIFDEIARHTVSGFSLGSSFQSPYRSGDNEFFDKNRTSTFKEHFRSNLRDGRVGRETLREKIQDLFPSETHPEEVRPFKKRIEGLHPIGYYLDEIPKNTPVIPHIDIKREPDSE